MSRRRFMIIGGAVAATLLLAGRAAQQSEALRGSGVLLHLCITPMILSSTGFGRCHKQLLHELGWIEGRNLQFDVLSRLKKTSPPFASAQPILVRCAPELLVVWPSGLGGPKLATQHHRSPFAWWVDPVGERISD